VTNESGPANVQRVTLGRIAELAGVSISTVSRALADDPQISARTREAVRRVADQLGYVPNAAARSLRSLSTRTLGLMLGDLSDPVHGLVAAGFETEARRHGYTVVIATGFGDLAMERDALRVFVEHRNDGVALISTVIDPSEIRAVLRPDRLVLVAPEHVRLAEGRDLPERGVVRVDEGAGFEMAVGHLVEQGCRSIGYVGVGLTASNVTRRAAVERAVRLAGLPPLRRFAAGPDAWRAPRDVAARIARDLPEGLICYEDKLALSIMDALRALGVEVPNDLSLVGFDGIPFAALSRPRLTTITQPVVEMGRLAAEMLIEAIRTGELRPSVLLPVELTIGESTRPRTAGSRTAETAASSQPRVRAGGEP
jgi:DNA-binding LacI/PurR family transcriptional regulator